jgi:hypothetical protein
MKTVKAAFFDSGSLYAFGRLAQLGEMAQEPLELEDLPIIERYVRTFVLHDATFLITPDAVNYVKPDNIEDLKRAVTDGMRGIEGDRVEIRSALLTGEWEKALMKTEEYPAELFKDLDVKWQEYARSVAADGCGLLVPPVLSIVLTRCARRDAIIPVLADLRSEWAGARKKVWDALDALRNSRTLGEAIKIRRELSESSKLFAPQSTAHDTRPIRVLWEIFAAGAVGLSVVAMSGGNRLLGAIAGALTQIPRSVPALLEEYGPVMFGRSAFDLARRVRRATYQVDIDALSRLLSNAEKLRIGIR